MKSIQIFPDVTTLTAGEKHFLQMLQVGPKSWECIFAIASLRNGPLDFRNVIDDFSCIVHYIYDMVDKSRVIVLDQTSILAGCKRSRSRVPF